MKRVIFYLLGSVMILSAQDNLGSARAALDSGFPKVALLKIEESIPLVGKPAAGDEANILYARALIADGQPRAAIKLLGEVSPGAGLEKEFWLAQALAANGDFPEALAKYTRCTMAEDFSFFREAALGRASMLRNLNRIDEAISVLEGTASWPTSSSKTQALLDLAELQILKGSGSGAEGSDKKGFSLCGRDVPFE